MTLTTLLIAATIPLTYSFPPAEPRQYDVSVHFEGYVPLFGGQPDANVEVKMQVEAVGLKPDAEGNPQVTNEIKQLQLMMNGTELPLQPESITRFFPKSTISMTPFGKVLKNDAPDKKLPVRLPGLHVRRFPD